MLSGFQGEMKVIVTFGGDAIPKSPFTVGVAAPLELGRVSVDNLDASKRSLQDLWSLWALSWFDLLQNV